MQPYNLCMLAFLSATICWYLLNSKTVYETKPSSSRGNSTASSTTFIFYKFSLQWPASSCRSHIRCTPPIPTEFTIHGLWPQDANDHGIEAYDTDNSCSTLTVVFAGQLLPYLTKDDFDQKVLLPAWPDLRFSRTVQNSKTFWRDEWKKHGMCSDYGDQPVEYFKIAVNLKNGLKSVLSKLKPGTTYSAQTVALMVGSQIGNKTPEIACSKDKNTKRLLLWEIRLCYDKGMPPNKLLDCPKKVSGKCSSGTDQILFP